MSIMSSLWQSSAAVAPTVVLLGHLGAFTIVNAAQNSPSTERPAVNYNVSPDSIVKLVRSIVYEDQGQKPFREHLELVRAYFNNIDDQNYQEFETLDEEDKIEYMANWGENALGAKILPVQNAVNMLLQFRMVCTYTGNKMMGKKKFNNSSYMVRVSSNEWRAHQDRAEHSDGYDVYFRCILTPGNELKLQRSSRRPYQSRRPGDVKPAKWTDVNKEWAIKPIRDSQADPKFELHAEVALVDYYTHRIQTEEAFLYCRAASIGRIVDRHRLARRSSRSKPPSARSGRWNVRDLVRSAAQEASDHVQTKDFAKIQEIYKKVVAQIRMRLNEPPQKKNPPTKSRCTPGAGGAQPNQSQDSGTQHEIFRLFTKQEALTGIDELREMRKETLTGGMKEHIDNVIANFKKEYKVKYGWETSSDQGGRIIDTRATPSGTPGALNEN